MNSGKQNPRDIEIDAEALHRKYAEERAKRLRPENDVPYPELKGQFAGFDRDQHADPHFARAPVAEEVDVAVIGGGFAGLLASGRMRQKGVESLRIIEKGADFGGTWYWNRYPGCACDVESYIYLPFLEELRYVPTQKYVSASEIFQYCRLLGSHYNLYDAALFQTVATELRWDEETRRWRISTNRGDVLCAKFVISCTGFLSNPKLPKIPGIDSFNGQSFHTSRWDYEATGGSAEGNLDRLAGKNVGIIGTGATAIQATPYLAQTAKHLYVFQRTPSSIDERNNRPTDLQWFNDLPRGWQRNRRDNFTTILCGGREDVDLVDDGWTDIIKHIPLPAGGESEAADPAELQIAGMKKMEMVRRRIISVVKDKRTAEALKPYFHYFCKRPGFHDGYLDVFNRDNVTLVDTAGLGVERITAAGVVAGGREYPLDLLIYATGFDFLLEYTRESGLEVYGRQGVRLSDHWKEGPRTLFGMQTHGFPNLFFMRVAQAGASFNYTHTVEEQSSYIAYIIDQCMCRGIQSEEPTREAEERWVQEVISKAGPRREFLAACTPSYYNYDGAQRARFALLNELYGDGPLPYFKMLRDLQQKGAMEGLALS